MGPVCEYRPNVEEVRRLARLARIDIDDEQARRLTHDLAAIVGLVADLPAGAARAASGAGGASACPLAPDDPEEGLSREQALDAAPARGDGLFLVPRVISR